MTAFLTTADGATLYMAGPENCCTPPSGSFNESGVYRFLNVYLGDTIGFQMGGSNFDINNILNGSLNLVQIPEPASAALLGLGLLSIGAIRRRRTRR